MVGVTALISMSQHDLGLKLGLFGGEAGLDGPRGQRCLLQEASVRDGASLTFPTEFIGKLLDAAWRCQFDFDRSYDDFKRQASGLIAKLAEETRK